MDYSVVCYLTLRPEYSISSESLKGHIQRIEKTTVQMMLYATGTKSPGLYMYFVHGLCMPIHRIGMQLCSSSKYLIRSSIGGELNSKQVHKWSVCSDEDLSFAFLIETILGEMPQDSDN